MEMKLKNVYLFEDENLDFTIKKKPTTRNFGEECLKDYPKIKYKKLNIIMGPNSSGKTNLGRVMWYFTLLVCKGNIEAIKKTVGCSNKDSKIEALVLEKNHDIYYLKKISIEYNSTEILSYKLSSVQINDSDKAYLNYKKDLQIIIETHAANEITRVVNENLVKTAWNFSFDKKLELEEDINVQVIESVLKNFDNSIEKVNKLEGKNRYEIKFYNGDYLSIDNGKIANEDRVSSGTLEAIHIVNHILWCSKQDGLYYFDEMMTRVHSELEIAVLNVFIQLLNKHEVCQLFFTTHNFEILDMTLPIHSYTFLNDHQVIYPLDTFKKGDRSLKNAVQKDLFGILPSTYSIDSILDVLL